MGKVISFINYKGGVGKTTCTMNLGTALWLLGHKVLLIDTDPQTSLSTVVGFNREDGSATLSDLLWSNSKSSTYPIYELHNGMDVMPCDDRLECINTMINKKGDYALLKRYTDLLKNVYDYILIDCKPGWSEVNECVMAASDGVIIPTTTDPLSIAGIDVVLRKLKGSHINLLGVLISIYDKGSAKDRANLKFIEEAYSPVFPVMMMRRKEIPTSQGNRQSIFEYNLNNDICHEYLRLAEHISGIQRKRNWKERYANMLS